MISRDYTKEVGLASHKKNLPRPVAFVVLAVVAVGLSFGVAEVINESRAHAAAEAAAKSVTGPVPGVADSAPQPAETAPAAQ